MKKIISDIQSLLFPRIDKTPKDYGKFYYYRYNNNSRIAGGSTPEDALRFGRAYLFEKIRDRLLKCAWPTAKIYYNCGNSGKTYYNKEYFLPTVAKFSHWARWKIAKLILGKKYFPPKGSKLWYHWFYGSASPGFPAIKWAIACKYASMYKIY